jgi:class 3 adenylate cyclase/tetratricopeptide (TPR) repeat protein
MRVCARCGEEAQEPARFCPNCGAAFEVATEQEERKLVSVLFVDIVGSTARADLADPEDVRDELRLFYERVREQIERFGGTAEKFIGDAVVAIFGAPLAHGDDAERAVRCGLRVIDAIAKLNDEHPELDLAVRAAVNTGEAVVTLGGGHERGDALVTGDVVNTAARLQSAAPPGRLVVGVETFRATRRDLQYEALPPIVAKGKRDRLEAWLALEPAPGGSDEPASPGRPFVGRHRELETLSAMWDQVTSDRRPHLATVLGPPGIGKTRLTTEFVDRATATDGRCIRGRCLPYEEQAGYQATAEQVKSVAGILETDPPRAAREKLNDALTSLLPADEVPDVARYLSLLLGLGIDEPTEVRLPLFFAARRLIEGLAEKNPLVVLFEDLHWADDSQFELLEYLGAHIRDVPVVFLATARPELVELRPAWGGGLVARTTIPLEPLAATEATAMAHDLLESSHALVDVDRVVEIAGGNPLFIEELASSRAEGVGGTTLPATVREAIASRIDLLPTEQRVALLDASVIGSTFWRGVLSAIGSTLDLDATLAALEARDLIRRAPRSRVEGDTEFAFKHVLIRDIAYGILPRAVRRARHAAVATHIESSSPESVRDLAWFLAHQWRQAGERRRAIEYLLLAAERAGEGWAKDEAIARYDDALELASDEDPALTSSIRLRRAIALLDVAEFEAGAAELDAILPGLEARDEFEALVGRLRAATWLEDSEQAQTLADRLGLVAEQLDEPELMGPALVYQGAVGILTGDLQTSIARFDKAFQVWTPGRRTLDLATLKEYDMEARYWVGDYAAAEALARSTHELGGETHTIEPLIRGGAWHGLTLAAMGRTEEAIELLDSIVEKANELGEPRWGAAALNYSSLAFRDVFLVSEARRRNEEALDTVEKHGEWGMPRLQGSIDILIADLMLGDVGAAQRSWPALWDAAINGKAWRPWLAGCRLALLRAEIAHRADGAEATIELANDAIERARRASRPKYEAAARALLGTALIEVGRAVEGLTELEAAVEEADRLGSPTARWQLRAELATARYTTGHDDAAAVAYSEADETIRGYAATLSPKHAAAFLGAESVQDVLKAADTVRDQR